MKFYMIAWFFWAFTLSTTAFAEAPNCHLVCGPSGNERGRSCSTLCSPDQRPFSFHCNSTQENEKASIQGWFQLEEYFWGGKASIVRGAVNLAWNRSGNSLETENLAILDGDFQEKGESVQFTAYSPQFHSMLHLHLNGAQSTISVFDGPEAGLSCTIDSPN